LVTGIIILEHVYHELTLKIETGPLFPVEIYIAVYNYFHHNDETFNFKKSNVATAHPTAAELRGITNQMNLYLVIIGLQLSFMNL